VLSLQDSPLPTPAKVLGDVTAKIPPNGQEISNIHPRAHTQQLKHKRSSWDLFLRTRRQYFLSTPPHSSYKERIILTSQLVQALRTMSIVKAVPKGIKERGCKRFALQECPPVIYVPEKDPVQETVSLLKSGQSLKTTIGADAELCLPNWHCGTREAFLLHVSLALNTIKKQGTFKAYKEAHEAYVEQRDVAKQAKADMSLFTTPTSKGKKATKRGLRKLPRRLLGRTALRKRRLLKRPRKARLHPTHQPQNFAKNTRPSIKNCVCKRDHQKPERSRCDQDVSVLCKLVVFG
jgi:hypothetical protein